MSGNITSVFGSKSASANGPLRSNNFRMCFHLSGHSSAIIAVVLLQSACKIN